MPHNQFLLLKERRFLPLFAAQFLGAFHDNLFKNTFVAMMLYGSMSASAEADIKILTTVAAGIFILPFLLFSGFSGQLADKFPKDRVIRVIKLAELLIAIAGVASILSASVVLSFITLFALGTHSAFFSPSKYSILPQHLSAEELIGGNALLNTGTFLAILFGTIIGTGLAILPAGPVIISVIIIVTALIGYASSRSIPAAPAIASDLKINMNVFSETSHIMRHTFQQPRNTILALLGIAWFYFLGGMFLSQFPNYAKETLQADEQVLTFFLVIFSIGIAIGGLLNNKLLKGYVSATYVPLAALGMSIFSLDLFFANHHLSGPALNQMHSLSSFLSVLSHWRIVVDVSLIALCGGLFVVPLNAYVQSVTPDHHRARILAGGAILDALFMIASALFSTVLIVLGCTIPELFLAFALANTLVAFYICALLPDYLFKTILQAIFKSLYRVEVRGLENVAKAGNRAIIVGNHVSLLDPPLLAAFLPGRPMFAVNSFVAEWWWVKPFLRLVDAFPLDPTNPFSMKGLIRKVEEDRHVVIFPEGRLTETGALMKVYDGPGMIADKTGALILPVRLDGVQHTSFARLKGKVPFRKFPKITITFLEPRSFTIPESCKGRQRRAAAGRQLYDLMEEMMFLTGDREQTLFQALLKVQHINDGKAVIAEDIERQPMQIKDLITASAVLGRKISRFTDAGETVGLMLPNSLGAITTFFALQFSGRVPAMLNFSTGLKSLKSSCQTGKIKTILTSRRFLELSRMDDVVAGLSDVAKIVYLEDIKKSVTFSDKALHVLHDVEREHGSHNISPQAPAVVLFTSGSEGNPKGVVLSHENLMSNIIQLTSRVDFNQQDIVFNCLPMFHSFGLTGGTLLPILCGVRTFLYPSPLHYRIIPEMVYSTNATIMFGTDTFLQGYARMANPYDFYRMRYIFAGAERVKEETRRTYMEKFGVQILEGYGATETAPVIAVNSLMHQMSGTVGRILPGLAHKLESVPGVPEGGRLYVRGPNVMLGYYLADNPGVLHPPQDGWHDTGDIVSINSDGFVRILGRAKRFAKIAGEMVSLVQAESIADSVWPGFSQAVVSIPDPRKGEQLALVTTHARANRDDLLNYAAQHGITPLAVPAKIIYIETMPVLGTGKTDYLAVQTFAQKDL